MPPQYGHRTANSVSTLSETIGIGILLLYLYMYCYPLFDAWGMTSRITDHILEAILKTGLFDDPIHVKCFSVIFIFFGILASPEPIERSQASPGGPTLSD